VGPASEREQVDRKLIKAEMTVCDLEGIAAWEQDFCETNEGRNIVQQKSSGVQKNRIVKVKVVREHVDV